MKDLNKAIRLIASKISVNDEGEYQLQGDLCNALVNNAAESALIIGAFAEFYNQREFLNPPEIQ